MINRSHISSFFIKLLTSVSVFSSVAGIAGCAGQVQQQRMTASASYGCTDTNYKDNRFSGSVNDDCGYQVVGRVDAGKVLTPILDVPKKEPVTNNGNGSDAIVQRPVNLFEFEIGYLNFGDTKFEGLFTGVSDAGTIKADGFLFGGVFNRKINNKSDLIFKVGVLHWNVEENEVYGGTPLSNEASGNSPYLGVGGRFWLNKRMAIRGEITRYFDVGKVNVTGEGDIDAIWIGLDIPLDVK
jgi:hypothetical protein